MADEIKQVMGFDVAQALQALQQLDGAFQKFETRIQSVGKTLQAFNSTSGTAAKSLGTSFKSGMGEATASTERLHTSLALLSRIAFTQLIVRGMSQIRNAIRSTANEAVQFQKKLALISTIDDSKTSFDKLGSSVRKLSDDFNLDLLSTADGLYQSLSNQVGDFATSLQFTADAAQFAKATNSSLADSVDLLSGALKSYNLDASETDRVSGIFFKTIDLGRITATELANSFGRVGPIAAELGVSLEETAGAMAAISVKGSKTSETLTQFRSILSALQKPTPELTKALNDLGFSSAEAALKTLGLPGTLRALGESAGGSAERMAKLFPNIRGLAGATSLASDDFLTLAKNIDEMTAAGANLSKEKFLQATATDAEKVTKEINKLKNAFTVELGQSVLKAGADLSQFVGGADRVIDVTKAAGPALLGLAGSFLLFRGSIAASNLELAGLSRSLGLLALLPAAQGAGVSLGNFVNSKVDENSSKALKALQATQAVELEAFKTAQSEKLAAANKTADGQVKAILKTVQQSSRLYLTDVANAKSANESLVTNTTAALTKIVSAREKLVDALAKSAADAREIFKDSQGRQSDVVGRADDRKFESNTRKLNDAQQVAALTRRAEESAARAAQQLTAAGKTGDKDSISKALALFDKAQGLGEQADSIGQRVNSRQLEARAAQSLNNITNKQLEAERQLQQLQAGRVAALDKERVKQQGITDQIRAATKIVLDNSSQFDANGNKFNDVDQAKRQAARQAALKTIATSALGSKDLTATSALGLADFVSRMQGELSRDPINLAFNAETAIQKLQADLKQSFAQFRVDVNLNPLEGALGKTPGSTSPDQAASLIAEGQAKAAALRAKISESATGGLQGQQLLKDLDVVFREISLPGRAKNRASFGDTGLQSEFDKILAQLRKVGEQATITDGDIAGIAKSLQAFTTTSQADINGRLGFGADVTRLEQAAQIVEKLKSAKAATADTGAAQELARVELALSQTNPSERFKGIAPAIGEGIAPAQAIEKAFAGAARNAEAMAAAAAGSKPPTAQALGGLQHLAAGGAAKGTDTIGALLSPGEFVVNARQSSRFFAQLQAINAGVAPSSAPAGGVTNNNGDIFLNVHSQSGQAVPRDIIDAIRREQRRGTRRI